MNRIWSFFSSFKRQGPCNEDTKETEPSCTTNINLKDSNGRTILHQTILEKCSSLLPKFIAMGADVNAVDNGGNTPLHFAAALGDSDSITVLIANGASINAKTLRTNLQPVSLLNPETKSYAQCRAYLQRLHRFQGIIKRMYLNRDVYEKGSIKARKGEEMQIIRRPVNSHSETKTTHTGNGKTARNDVVEVRTTEGVKMVIPMDHLSFRPASKNLSSEELIELQYEPESEQRSKPLGRLVILDRLKRKLDLEHKHSTSAKKPRTELGLPRK